MKLPTPYQLEILRFCAKSVDERGAFPSLREICAEFGVASTNGVFENLARLEKKGLISSGPLGKSRVRTITEAGWLASAQPSGRTCRDNEGTIIRPVRCVPCGRQFFRGTEANHVCATEDLSEAS